MVRDDAQNARLLAQVEALSGAEHLEREAAPWREATPQERLAVVVELCAAIPVLQAAWPPEIAARAAAAEPLPEDTRRILERLRAESRG